MQKVRREGNPRFIVDDEKGLLIVTNYKCGFATLNHALNLNPDVKSTRNISSLADVEKPNKYRKIIFSRNPYDRFLSFYVNWVVNRSPEKTPNKTRAFDLLKKSAPESVWRLFCQASREEKLTNDFIDLYVLHIADVILHEPHLHPQHLIYQRSGLTIDFFDEVRPMEDNTRIILEEYGIEARVVNQTNSSSRAGHLVTPHALNFCNSAYARDFVDFEFDRQ